MGIKAVIFDLDGVIVATDEYHYLAWQRLADEEGIEFNRVINNRLRGVSRRRSLEILLEKAGRDYTEEEKREMAQRKNGYYREFLKTKLTPDAVLPGVHEFLKDLRDRGVKTAVASASRNTPLIMERIGMAHSFDAVADGNDITHSKPDPEVFLLAARRLGTAPADCLVVEDAEAGVEAGLTGGMKVLAVGYASDDTRADCRAKDIASVNPDEVL
ncbi:MAG: beta-phosphoglucomutase [Kiritimatiellia bacterium]